MTTYKNVKIPGAKYATAAVSGVAGALLAFGVFHVTSPVEAAPVSVPTVTSTVTTTAPAAPAPTVTAIQTRTVDGNAAALAACQQALAAADRAYDVVGSGLEAHQAREAAWDVFRARAIECRG